MDKEKAVAAVVAAIATAIWLANIIIWSRR